jgi:hypothetical protein
MWRSCLSYWVVSIDPRARPRSLSKKPERNLPSLSLDAMERDSVFIPYIEYLPTSE